MKRYKFEFGGMYVFYMGKNLGEAIKALLEHRGYTYLIGLESITEEPFKYERP